MDIARDQPTTASEHNDALAWLIEQPGHIDAARLLASTAFNPRHIRLPSEAQTRIAHLLAQAAPAATAREEELAASSRQEAEVARALGRAVRVDLRKRDASRLDLVRMARSARFVTLAGETLALRAEDAPATIRASEAVHAIALELAEEVAAILAMEGALTQEEVAAIVARVREVAASR